MRRIVRRSEVLSVKEDSAQVRIIQPITKQPECLLEAMELIAESSRNSNLSDQFFEAVELPSSYLAERLQINKIQAVMLSLLMNHSEDDSIRLCYLEEYTMCSTTRLFRFSKEMEGLERKFYIKINKGSSYDTYRITREVKNSFRDDVAYVHKPTPIADVNEFFDQYTRLLNERCMNEISTEMLINLNEENLDQIKDTHFAQCLKMELPLEEDRLLFVNMAHLYLYDMNDFIKFNDICRIYDDDEVRCEMKNVLRNRTSNIQRKLIENSNNNGFAEPDSYRLTRYAKEDVLSEVSMHENSHYYDHHLSKWETFQEKTLFYNEREGEQISQLTALLMPEKFKEIQNDLESAGMRRGFCCLFYGAPGTGKTETVYQIARQTGRDILQINVNEIKSCWVGESEKNITSMFDRYRSICQERPTAPIMLFNEADAILGLRMEGAVRGVEKMENSLQNIILQEMESLDGIMIATTNLSQNLDKAFERRFLYKIKYDKPSEDARCGIWMDKLNGISEEEARLLATRFCFSGGEIENIVRKNRVASILSGTDSLDINNIMKLCEEERLDRSVRRIGF